MRTIISVGALVLTMAGISAACVRGEVAAPPSPSARNVKIRVSLENRPASEVRLLVRFSSGAPDHWLQTGSDGTAMLRDLPEGTACVHAIGEKDLYSTLCLAVSTDVKSDISKFDINLAVAPSRFRDPKDVVAEAEHLYPVVRVTRLSGTVLDANAAVIPRVEIHVFKQGTYPNNPVKTLNTNAEGHFSDLLAAGIYTIVIHKPWFRSEVLAVEISPDGGENELRQTLQVGTDCDW